MNQFSDLGKMFGGVILTKSPCGEYWTWMPKPKLAIDLDFNLIFDQSHRLQRLNYYPIRLGRFLDE